MRNSKEVIRLIKKLRESKEMSVEELANRVGIAKSSLSRYENEQRSFPINDIGLYANALGTTVEFLLGIGTQSNVKLSSNDMELIRKYNSLDDIGKYTVDTTLDVQYKRCTSQDNDLIAAHSDDYSEEQQKLMLEDIAELERLHNKRKNK
ncbi:hypothetical protein J40TS1_34470 [Paenibacillus montaniterrae]|uniref:HTH cro/C1-type domain-containing protein n=1 Tax=Paenibacillus montaniterrae TaxID=429341 RepID=A0A919YQH3_9BACL|nr:helix-turn-helix transcriptional regulator [Paenibacillus montaniterrae]GIP17805.1 hypothetical protein J40TS1_34470 [Paenibacillus montaniterrae]